MAGQPLRDEPVEDWERDMRATGTTSPATLLAAGMARDVMGLGTFLLLFGGIFGRDAEEIYLVALVGGLAVGALVDRLS